jgi:CheY-like chemotaxis protein
MQFDDTILVADDQAINLEVIKQHLNRLNFMGISHFAVDGQECIDSAKEIFDYQLSKVKPGQKNVRPIAIMLLDLQMPKKTGIQVVAEVKAMYKRASSSLRE